MISHEQIRRGALIVKAVLLGGLILGAALGITLAEGLRHRLAT